MTNTGNSLRRRYGGHTPEWYDERTDYMSGFLTGERIQTLRRTLAMRTRYMTILTENTFHPQNASALVRHCEAFGVQDLHTVETMCRFDPSVNIVRGTDKWIDIIRHDSTEEAIASLKASGYRIVATTPHRESCTPETFDVEKGRFCLVFGTEHAGVSPQIISAADEFLRIPMCGMVESLNVSASAAILIYMLSQRMRLSDVAWRLSEAECSEVMFRWVMSSVRDARRILERRFGAESGHVK
mgnify:CR=1 FL=1